MFKIGENIIDIINDILYYIIYYGILFTFVIVYNKLTTY